MAQIALISPDPNGKTSNTIAHFALDFPRKESVCVSRTPSLTGSLLSPRQRRWASAGFGWWRRAVAPMLLRGVLHDQAQICANEQGAVFIESPIEGRPQPNRRSLPNASEFETGASSGTAARAERRHHCQRRALHRLAATHSARLPGFMRPHTQVYLYIRRRIPSDQVESSLADKRVSGRRDGAWCREQTGAFNLLSAWSV
jgi:hypothetical protein